MKMWLLSMLPLLALLLTLSLHTTPAAASRPQCNPRSAQERTCMRGCLTCWKTYGGFVYDMAACCSKCTSLQAVFVDLAPSNCEHVQKNWLKRFGKRYYHQ